jgi:hypothetical protein
MEKKITFKNIYSFIQGNLQMRLDGIGLKPQYYQEQIAYRMLQCQDCIKAKQCKECGCELPGKFYVNESCNGGERFPNIMSERDWEQYKENNGI